MTWTAILLIVNLISYYIYSAHVHWCSVTAGGDIRLDIRQLTSISKLKNETIMAEQYIVP